MVAFALRAAFAICLLWAGPGCETAAPYEFKASQGTSREAKAERPTFSVGDEFWFDTSDGAIVVEVFSGEEDGLLVFRRNLQNETFYYSPDLALVKVRRPFGSDQWFDPDDGLLEFPLTVGKTWSRTFRVRSTGRRRSAQRTRRCEVVSAGQANVPAGSFAAYRIDCTLRELGHGRVAHEEIIYAPVVGRVISHYSGVRGADIRLTEFSRAPR